MVLKGENNAAEKCHFRAREKNAHLRLPSNRKKGLLKITILVFSSVSKNLPNHVFRDLFFSIFERLVMRPVRETSKGLKSQFLDISDRFLGQKRVTLGDLEK